MFESHHKRIEGFYRVEVRREDIQPFGLVVGAARWQSGCSFRPGVGKI